GQRFSFQVTSDVAVNGTMVIGKGAIGWGKVTNAAEAKGFGRAAKLEFVLDYVTAFNGEHIPVRDYHERLGGTSKATTAAGVAGSAAVMGGVGVFGLALT